MRDFITKEVNFKKKYMYMYIIVQLVNVPVFSNPVCIIIYIQDFLGHPFAGEIHIVTKRDTVILYRKSLWDL